MENNIENFQIEKFVVDHYTNHLKWFIQLSESLIISDTTDFLQIKTTVSIST